MDKRIKILHVPYTYYPDPVGGTEVYLASLVHQLIASDIDIVIAAPGIRDDYYIHNGLSVRRFRHDANSDLRQLYGIGDPVAAQSFERVLMAEQPHLVHLHAFTSAVSIQLVRVAHHHSIPVVFTYHTPTVSCQRGTLLHLGQDICDGVLQVERCASCVLQGQGLPLGLAKALSRIPATISQGVAATQRTGRVQTALRMRELVGLRHEAFRQLVAEVDHIVAVASWVQDLLLCNGVQAEKVTLSPQGLPYQSEMKDPVIPPLASANPLRIAFLGRLDATKGLHTLIDALGQLPDASLTLDCYGIVQGDGNDSYSTELRTRAIADNRIAWLPPVPSTEIVATLRRYHLLTVPSQWLETGPLVVLEAFAAGVPVLGSRLGGIAERVRDGVDGLLVAHDDPAAWANALHRILAERELLATLRSGITPPRTSRQVADEMMSLYRRLLRSG